VGQRVRLSFASYPAQVVGFVLGIVQDISILPKDSTQFVRIDLQDGLRTSYGTQLTLQQKMRGSAEISTDEVSLLDRFMNRLRIAKERHSAS